jgi:predicted negative regulator of RcsB-dependent stress response
MSKYTRKQKGAPQDEFVGFWEKLAKKAEPYAMAIGITAATAAVLIAVVWGVMSWMEKKSQAATELYGRAVRIYEADLVSGDEPPKPDEVNPVPRFKTEKERAEAALQTLDELDKKYGHAAITDEATLFRASIYFDQGRTDDAASAYEKFLKGAHASPLVATAKEGLGIVREGQGKLDEALSLYQQIEPKVGDYYRDRALWDQARVWQKKGDKKKAVEIYKQLIADVPGSPLREDVQGKLTALDGE